VLNGPFCGGFGWVRRAFNDQFWALVSARAGAVVDGAMAHGYKRLRLDSLDRCAPDEAPSRSTDGASYYVSRGLQYGVSIWRTPPPAAFYRGHPGSKNE
jgi:hypothetical protein